MAEKTDRQQVNILTTELGTNVVVINVLYAVLFCNGTCQYGVPAPF